MPKYISDKHKLTPKQVQAEVGLPDLIKRQPNPKSQELLGKWQQEHHKLHEDVVRELGFQNTKVLDDRLKKLCALEQKLLDLNQFPPEIQSTIIMGGDRLLPLVDKTDPGCAYILMRMGFPATLKSMQESGTKVDVNAIEKTWDRLVSLAEKTNTDDLPELMWACLPVTLKAIQDSGIKVDVNVLDRVVSLAGKTKPEHVYELMAWGLPNTLKAIQESGMKADITVLNTLVSLAGKTEPENVPTMLRYALPVALKAVSSGKTGDIEYLWDRVVSQGILEEGFWRASSESTVGIKCSVEELRDSEHIPLPVFLGLKKLFGGGIKDLRLDWNHINRSRDSTRGIVHYLASKHKHKKELLSKLQSLPGSQADSILLWTMILGRLRVDYYHDFTDAGKYEDKLREIGVEKATKKMDLSAQHKQLLMEHPGIAETNLLEILASLTSFMPDEQIKVLKIMTEAYAKDRWTQWRYETDLGKKQLEFLTPTQQQIWRENTVKPVTVTQASKEAKTQALLGILDSAQKHVQTRYPDLDFTLEYLKQLQELAQQHPTKKGREYGRLQNQALVVDRILFLRDAIQKPETPPGEILGAVKGLKTAFKDLKVDEPKNDIIAFERSFRGEIGKVSGRLMLRETDDLVDMLNTGTIPYPTCQRWTEKTKYNISLPHYASDAIVKELQLVDSKNNIVSREVFRVLDTNKGIKIIPEPTHPLNNEYRRVFAEALQEKAEKMSKAGPKIEFKRLEADKKYGLTIYYPESCNKKVYSDTLWGATTVASTPTTCTK